jgi:hypothetical protein
MGTFILTVAVFSIIVDIMNLIMEDHKEKLRLKCVWPFTHVFCMLMALAGLASSMSICIPSLRGSVVG